MAARQTRRAPEEAGHYSRSTDHQKRESSSRISKFFKALGPGLITGASDDDPSGIGTYAQCGAQFGTSFLWSSLLTFPLMAAVQYLCAKIALVTGRGLAGVLRKHYPRPILYSAVLLLVVANTINVGADLGAVAAGINLVAPAVNPKLLVIPLAVLILCLQMFGSYKFIAGIFKWLTLTLFAYIATAFFVHADFHRVLKDTLVPNMHFDRDGISMLVALLGTTISPYLFFWQASQEVEEAEARGRRDIHKRGAKQEHLQEAAIDVNVGMLASNLVMFFIIYTTAATLNKAHHTDIQSAEQAAQALKPLAGSLASELFALGLIGTGMLAIPVLVGSSAFAVAEALGWRFSLNKKPSEAKAIYSIMAASIFAGAAINFTGINAMDALFITAVINGVLAPPLLLLIMMISRNKDIMGDQTAGRTTTIIGWLCTALMFAAAAALMFVALSPK